MPLAVCTTVDLVSLLEKFSTKEKLIVHIAQQPIVRLVRMATETFDGIRSPTNKEDLKSKVEIPDIAEGEAQFLKVTGQMQGPDGPVKISSTKYLATNQKGVWLVLRIGNVLYIVPESFNGSASVRDKFKEKKNVAFVTTRSFCFHAQA
jgi:hypothetical protein